MNKRLRNITIIISIVFIVWFLLYFLIGNFINLEFSNSDFSKIFPKILTFLASVSVYVLFLISIEKGKGWSFFNVMKFVLGIVVAFIPLVTFEYFSIDNCATWKVSKHDKKTIYQSVSSASETIRLIEIDCPAANRKTLKVNRVMQVTPMFRTVSEIDTLKISDKNWKKL